MSRKKKTRRSRGSRNRRKATAAKGLPETSFEHYPSSKKLKVSPHFLFLLILAPLLVFAIYFNSLHGPFLFDDTNNIRDNSAIKIVELDTHSLTSAGLDSPHPRRFVAYISFALNYYFHQEQTLGYHLVNVSIHLLSGLLIYQLVRLTLSMPSLKSRYDRTEEIALFVALLWLAHPMAAQSVAYLVQRMNSLATLFYLASLVSYVQGRSVSGNRRVLWYVASGLAAVLAFGSKEIAATLPFFILLYEWFFFRDLDLVWAKRQLPKLGLLILVALVAGLLATHGDPLSGFSSREFTLTERLLTQSRVVLYYVSLLLLPHPSRLTINHDFSVSYGLLDPVTTLLSILVVLALLVTAVMLASRDRLLSFCILWYFGHLAIESSVIPLELIFEHRTYLPSVGLIWLGVVMFYRFTGDFKYHFVPLAILVLLLSLWANERSQVWSDKVGFWSDAVAKSPKVARVYNNLGVALEEQGRLDEALIEYRKAFSLDPLLFRALNNIGTIHFELKNYNEALQVFKQSRDLAPSDVDAYKGLALTYYAMRDQKRYVEYLGKVREMERKIGR